MAVFTRAQLPLCNGKFQGNFGGICTRAIRAADSSFRAEKNVFFRISYAAFFFLMASSSIFFVTEEKQCGWFYKTDPRGVNGEYCCTPIHTQCLLLMLLAMRKTTFPLPQMMGALFTGLIQFLLIHMWAGHVFTHASL